MTLSVNRRYIPEVDHIRAFAALLVLFYHGSSFIGAELGHGTSWLFPSNPILAIIEEGHSGVGLFIVLSGFILSLGAIGHTVSYKPFLLPIVISIAILTYTRSSCRSCDCDRSTF
jgi:peptidoglycan/LPS O-acetylase OafA/YrhL